MRRILSLAEFGQSEEKLGKICAEPGFSPNLNREANCESIKKATIELAKQLFGLLVVDEGDTVKLASTVAELGAAMDVYVIELGKVATETGDAALRTAVIAAAKSMTVAMKMVPAAAKDYQKLRELMDSDFTDEQDKMGSLCPR